MPCPSDLESGMNSSASRPHSDIATERSLLPPHWSRTDFHQCEWFTRGWTLQEMVAPAPPAKVHFFNKSWTLIAALPEIADEIHEITGVHKAVLTGKSSLDSFSIAQKMSWAAHRVTSKKEDRAYSMLGIFGINMPTVYGEGTRAFHRLQLELLQNSSDQTLFVFESPESLCEPREFLGYKSYRKRRMCPLWVKPFPLLAHSPKGFANCGNIVTLPSASGEKFQMIGKEIEMSLNVRADYGDKGGSCLGVFLHLFWRRPPKTRRMPFKALLACTESDARTRMIFLNLFPVLGRPDTYCVGAEEDPMGLGTVQRIQLVDFHSPERDLRYSIQTFKVLQSLPQHTEATDTTRGLFHFQYDRQKISLRLRGPPALGGSSSWNAAKDLLDTDWEFFTVEVHSDQGSASLNLPQMLMKSYKSFPVVKFSRNDPDGRDSLTNGIFSRYYEKWNPQAISLQYKWRGALVATSTRLSGAFETRNVSVVKIWHVSHARAVVYTVLYWLSWIYTSMTIGLSRSEVLLAI